VIRKLGTHGGARYLLAFDEHGIPVVAAEPRKCPPPFSGEGWQDAQVFLDGENPPEIKAEVRRQLESLGFPVDI